MKYFSSLQSNTFSPLGWLYPIQREVTSLNLCGCWTTLVGRDKTFNSLFEVFDRASKGGPPILLCLMQNKLNLLGGVWSGFASVLEPLWQAKTKSPFLYATNICLCMPGRPPTLVLTGNFLPFSSITKSWRNWNSSTIIRKYNWWMISLFKQNISDFRQNDLVLIPVDDFLFVDWVLDILELQEG